MIISVGWSHVVKHSERAKILVPGTDSLLHLRHYLLVVLPGLEQRKPAEAGITASIWYATLHYHKFYKSLFPKWFQDAV